MAPSWRLHGPFRTLISKMRQACAEVYGSLEEEYISLICSSLSRPLIKHDYPLNLSISLSGGKETNKDSLSNGE